MKQLQLKMHEYNNGKSWLPGGMWPVDENAPDEDLFGPQVGVDVDVDVDVDGEVDALPEDEDTEDASEELVDMRRKNRSHTHQESIWTSSSKKGEAREVLLTPKQGRAHKKLRSRKVHKLTLLAPEAAMLTEELSGTSTTAGLVQHFEGLSVVEIAGPSTTTPMKKMVNLATPVTENGDELRSREEGEDETRHRSRDGSRDGCSDAEGRMGSPSIDTVEGMELENKQQYPYYKSSAMNMSGSGPSNSFCIPEIEDWGNLKNDPIS